MQRRVVSNLKKKMNYKALAIRSTLDSEVHGNLGLVL